MQAHASHVYIFLFGSIYIRIKKTMDGHSNKLLQDLSPPIETFPYKGRQQFTEIFNSKFESFENQSNDNACAFILFSISEQDFTRDFLYSSSRDLFSKSWSTYSASEELLLIKMMGPEHAAALGAFQDAFCAAVEPTGLRRTLKGFPGKTMQGTNRRKQGDGGWAPKRPPRGRSKKWPTVVLEVAVSETHSKLLSDVRFWLYESQGDVNVVLGLTFNRQTAKITIEKWELEDCRICRTQIITISKSQNGGATVENDPLVIEFDKLFLRDPETPRETDICIDCDELHNLADTIWSSRES